MESGTIPNVGPIIMRKLAGFLLVTVAAVIMFGCGDAVSQKDKDATATKFKALNKNDVNHNATP